MSAKSRNNVSGPQVAPRPAPNSRHVGGRGKPPSKHNVPENPFANFPPPPTNRSSGLPLPPPPAGKRSGVPLPHHNVPETVYYPPPPPPAANFLPPPPLTQNFVPPPPPPIFFSAPPKGPAGKGPKGKPQPSFNGTPSVHGPHQGKAHALRRNGPPPFIEDPGFLSFDSFDSFDDSFYDHLPAPPKPAPKKAVLHGPAPAARRQSSFSSASSSSASTNSFGSALTDSTMLDEKIHISDDMQYMVKIRTKKSPRRGISATVDVGPLLPGKIHHTVSRLTPKKPKGGRGQF